MSDLLLWPLETLVPNDPQGYLAPYNTSGGRNALGLQQVVGNAPPIWNITYNDVLLGSPSQVRKFREIADLCDGMANPICVPLCEQARGPLLVSSISLLNVMFDDGLGFSDGLGFDDNNEYGGSIWSQALGAIAVGTVAGEISVQFGTAIEAGMVFGHGYEYAYSITKVVSVDDSGDYPVYSVIFKPPARAVIAAGTVLNFNNPHVRCVLASDSEMAMPKLDQWRFGQKTVAFVEDV